MIQKDLKWYQKKNGIIIVLILFFPVGLYLMWKHSDWNNKTKVIITSIFLIGAIFSKTDESSDSKINESLKPSLCDCLTTGGDLPSGCEQVLIDNYGTTDPSTSQMRNDYYRCKQ